MRLAPSSLDLFKFKGVDGQIWTARLALPISFNSQETPRKSLVFDFIIDDWDFPYRTHDGLFPGYTSTKIKYLSPEGVEVETEVIAGLNRYDKKVHFAFRHWPELDDQTSYGIKYQAADGRIRTWKVLEGNWLAEPHSRPNDYYAVEASCVDVVPGWGVDISPPVFPRV